MIRTTVAELSEEKGLPSHVLLGEFLGLHRQHIAKLIHEKGTTPRIELETIEKLCRGFNVMPNELFLITNEDGSPWKAE
jgi:DNA-binding Xre family transcriptional regulator